jgi:hypothetical protein
VAQVYENAGFIFLHASNIPVSPFSPPLGNVLDIQEEQLECRLIAWKYFSVP